MRAKIEAEVTVFIVFSETTRCPTCNCTLEKPMRHIYRRAETFEQARQALLDLVSEIVPIHPLKIAEES